MKEDTGPSEVEKTVVGECACLQCASRERAWNLEQVRVCGAGEAKVDEGEGECSGDAPDSLHPRALDRGMGYFTSLSPRFFMIIPVSDKTQQVVDMNSASCKHSSTVQMIVTIIRASVQPRDWTQVSCIAGGVFTVWAIREALLKTTWVTLHFLTHCRMPL